MGYPNKHNNLYNTLKERASYVRDGLNAKARIVIKEAPVAPPAAPKTKHQV
jgi:hypothetical protein